MDRKLNNKTIGYIVYIDEFLREKEESKYKVRKGFPQAYTVYIPHRRVTPELFQGHLYFTAI